MASLLVIGSFNLSLHECLLIDDRFYKGIFQSFICMFLMFSSLSGRLYFFRRPMTSFAQFISSLYFSGSWYAMHTEYASSIKAVLTLFQSCWVRHQVQGGVQQWALLLRLPISSSINLTVMISGFSGPQWSTLTEPHSYK